MKRYLFIYCSLVACAIQAGFISQLAAAKPNDAVVVFNEIFYNPLNGDSAEYVELINVMAVNVDLSGWQISSGVNFVFPNGTVIAGGATLVVAKTPGLYPGALGPFTGVLSNGGEMLRLRDNNERAMDELTYSDKGTWPVAADGGGVSLAKRNSSSNSGEAASWTGSAQQIGTPGFTNFPAQQPPTTTQVIGRFDSYKYSQANSVAANWNTVAFNDTSWSSGSTGVYFGNSTIYATTTAPPVTRVDQWFVKPWTGDSSSEISTAKNYTHKIGLNRSGGYTAINGVTFTSPGSNVRSGTNWSISGATEPFTNNNSENNLPGGSGSRQLCEEFFYLGNPSVTPRLTLSGLTSGQTYTVVFYSAGYGVGNQRQVLITPSDTGTGYLVDQNFAGSGNGILVKYRYVAPVNGVMNFDFSGSGYTNWHHCAFSNEVSPALIPQAEVTATVSDVSSQLLGTSSRSAVNCVNGSGLISGQHGTVADNTMWLTHGTVAAPNDLLPAEITFDLGATINLAGFNVWNYNSVNSTNRGANQVVIQTAVTENGPFSTAATVNFRIAQAVSTEPGERFDLNVNGVRKVKFIINSSHGGDNNLVGLSEVKFFKQGLSGIPPLLPKEKITPAFNTGETASHGLASIGSGDPHWTNVATGQPAVVMSPNPAWLGSDGLSQWIGASASGNDSALNGLTTYRTTFDLSGYDSSETEVRFFACADNSLDNVLLNGATTGISMAGYNALIGPFTLSGPFNTGLNTADFVWDNAGGPGALRVKWDILTQINYGKTILPTNPPTTYLRRTFTHVGNPSSSYRLLLNFVADDGAIFYLNGTEIHRSNMPAGAVTSASLATSEVAFPTYNGVIEVPSSSFLAGQQNVFAVELHQASAANADAFFLATLDVEETFAPPAAASALRFHEIAGAASAAGAFFIEVQNTGSSSVSLAGYQIRTSGFVYSFGAQTLAAGELLSINQTMLGFRPADGASLFLASPASAIGDATVVKNSNQARNGSGAWLVPNAASPGAANTFTVNNSIVINEIMYNHHATFLPTGRTLSTEEWVELHNRSASAVLLTGWKIRGSISYDFAAGTQIPAGGYLVCANDPAALLAKFPGITAVGPCTGKLSNTDDTIRLEDAAGNPASEVRYFSDGRWDKRADGGGSSLELRNPAMDSKIAESWAASDENTKATWTNISYSGLGASFPGTNDPNGYHEFILGMLNGGECLVDDVSVREVSVGNRQVIQNGSFSNTAKWRNLGNHGSHGRTIVVPDPIAPGNNVLKIVATGATEHMHNHCETTFANGITINPASTYDISFRARWVSGCPRLQSRLYFNRLARQHLLPMPTNTGTPGAVNSRYSALTGPTFSGLTHSPTLPSAQQSVTIRIAATDPQGVTNVALKWKLDEASSWNTAAMTINDGAYQGQIAGQAAGALVQFYAEASDGTSVSNFPAAGTASRAMIRWSDGTAPTTPGHGIRILMATTDADFMHTGTNVMSNDSFPCTVIYRESEVFYDANVRLKSSQRGRLDNARLGFALEFDPMHLFRGAHATINIDRSGYGRGTNNSGNGHSEIIHWQVFNRAAGIPSMYNDMAYVIAPRSVNTGSAILTMAEFNDVWADSQYENGADFPGFKYELTYYPTTTDDGTPEGLKVANPDEVSGVEFGSINSPDKEAFRWNFLIGNARNNDDFTRLINLSNTYQLTGSSFNSAIINAIDVDQWLRASAALALSGISDNYATSSGAWHNLKLYHRPDGRILYLPWDLDYQYASYDDSLIINPDILALTQISPAYQRLFYQHLDDIINTSFNSAYLSPWVSHYASFNASGGNWNEITSYVDQRVAYVRSQIAASYPVIPFNITTAGFSTGGTSTTITGSGWIDIRTIVIQPGGLQIPVTWTSGTTWQAVIPVTNGSQTVTLQALDRQGNVVGTDFITGFGTGTAAPATGTNLVISEIHYNPAIPTGNEIPASNNKDEFEFIEIRNISSSETISLAGCRFIGGIDYTLPNTTLAPGAYAVIPRNTSAFNARYSGVTTLAPDYYIVGGNFLSNDGEEIALVNAASQDITRVAYNDSSSPKWPSTPDGGGTSLVLIAPLTNPVIGNPLHWRASSATHGNPGTSDALPAIANPSGDNNGNGINNLTEHAIGSGKFPAAGIESVLGQPTSNFTLERNSIADVNWSLETHTTLSGPWTPADTNYEITARTQLPFGIEKIVLRSLTPLAGPRGFMRAKLTVP